MMGRFKLLKNQNKTWEQKLQCGAARPPFRPPRVLSGPILRCTAQDVLADSSLRCRSDTWPRSAGLPGALAGFHLSQQFLVFPLYLCFSVKPSFSLFLSCLVSLPFIWALNERWRMALCGAAGVAGAPGFSQLAALLLLGGAGEIQIVPQMSARRSPHRQRGLLGLPSQATTDRVSSATEICRLTVGRPRSRRFF